MLFIGFYASLHDDSVGPFDESFSEGFSWFHRFIVSWIYTQIVVEWKMRDWIIDNFLFGSCLLLEEFDSSSDLQKQIRRMLAWLYGVCFTIELIGFFVRGCGKMRFANLYRWEFGCGFRWIILLFGLESKRELETLFFIFAHIGLSSI